MGDIGTSIFSPDPTADCDYFVVKLDLPPCDAQGRSSDKKLKFLVSGVWDPREGWKTNYEATDGLGIEVLTAKGETIQCADGGRKRGNEREESEVQTGRAGETEDEIDNSELSFHQKKGEWAEIVNSNRTAYRKVAESVDTGGLVFSNRPLKRNEMFEVTLDKMSSEWSIWSWALGVTAVSPDDLEMVPEWIADIGDGTYYAWESNVSKDAHRLVRDYGPDLRYMQVGDRVGALVNSDGELHFFHNGNDLGIAAKEMNDKTLYGVVDVRNCAVQVTLTN